ncbi:MAG: L-threonylcarbamoyladenylate synthase [Candidatus Omnitrophica bacterium]|nr:L-threonylcarbamoyladenylate synthase [Candidatus Omnitrophota bacterium]
MIKKYKNRIIKINPRAIDEGKLKEAAERLHEGALVIFPTETVYGIGVHPSFKEAVDRLYEIKKRPKDKPFSLHLANYLYAKEFQLLENHAFSFLSKKFWPGPLTLIVKDKKDKRFGFRMPRNPISMQLIEMVGEPILVTSVNITGEEPALSIEEIPADILEGAELAIDGGRCELGEESTIVDLSNKPYRVVRPGARRKEIEFALKELNDGPLPKRNVLLVCTGNSCRSPMAEGWLKHMAGKKGKTEYHFESCGIIGHDGCFPTMEARTVCAEDSVDIVNHSSRTITKEIVEAADEIIAMSDEHEQFILKEYPYLLGRIKILAIPDPIGMDLDFYRETYRKIKEKLRIAYPWLKE